MDPLPDLTIKPCEACGGDGYLLESGDDAGDGLPAEYAASCPTCGGAGELEVCAGCLTVPEVVGGLEQCACATVTLKRAA